MSGLKASLFIVCDFILVVLNLSCWDIFNDISGIIIKVLYQDFELFYFIFTILSFVFLKIIKS